MLVVYIRSRTRPLKANFRLNTIATRRVGATHAPSIRGGTTAVERRQPGVERLQVLVVCEEGVELPLVILIVQFAAQLLAFFPVSFSIRR